MSNRALHLDELMDSIISASEHKKECLDVNNEYQKMLKVLTKVIEGELTDRQRECVFMYYGNNMKIKDISKQLNIYPSTVSRHLKKSKTRVELIISYYFSRLSKE